MAGKQAKLLTDFMVTAMIKHIRKNRYPDRDIVIILLSTKAGLRAGEIAQLTWQMVLDANGKVGKLIELHDIAAKKLHGRTIPINPLLRHSLIKLHKLQDFPLSGEVILSERKTPIKPASIVKWFKLLYNALGYNGCSSHSGRRSFVTKAARNIHLVGGSLKDVQQLAGHCSLETTQAYIEGDSNIKRKLINLL
ncbi:MAG: site-specific integrase [Rickettsiales bacterium]